MNLNNHTIVTAGVRGFLCAGLATALTAFFSWSFVASTDNLNWMGSSTLDQSPIAMTREDAGPRARRA